MILKINRADTPLEIRFKNSTHALIISIDELGGLVADKKPIKK